MTQFFENIMPINSSYFFINPSDYGINDDSRICIFNNRLKKFDLIKVMSFGENFTIDWSDFQSHLDYKFKIQVKLKNTWVDSTKFFSITDVFKVDNLFLSNLESQNYTFIDPRIYGIDKECRVDIYDNYREKYVLSFNIEKNQLLVFPDIFFSDISYCNFQIRIMENGVYKNVVKRISLTPRYLKSKMPSFTNSVFDNLKYSLRSNVTLIPHLSVKSSSSGSIYGFIGAYEDGSPIPEAVRMVMGRQMHLFAPFEEAEQYIDETVIYADIPNSSYGHFITEGLARLWFAKANPNIPIVWNFKGPKLSEMQQSVLNLFGITNRQFFLNVATRFKEVIFPLPGVSLGDFLLAEHAKFLGVVKPESIIPGKKLFLSRGKLNTTRGLIESESELESILEGYGFVLFHPERYSLKEQLSEISSAELVLGLEGSAMHSVLFLCDPVRTKFISIGRHRMGSGIFEHIKQAKQLDYCTLKLFEVSAYIRASDQTPIDIELLKNLLFQTQGFTKSLNILNQYLTMPNKSQRCYTESIKNFKTSLTDDEKKLYQLYRALPQDNQDVALLGHGKIFQPTYM